MLDPGTLAPSFTAETTRGTALTLGELRGGIVVLYFFPKAFTPGCTVETKGFRDNYETLKERGAEVIGISTDGFETQCAFAREHKVTFPMIADTGQKITRLYDVRWPLLPLAKRVTYVIDELGVIRDVFRHELQVSKHLDDVLLAVSRLRQEA